MKLKKFAAILVAASLAGFMGFRIYEARKQHAEAPKKGAKKGGARIVSVSVGQARVGRVREEILLTGALRPKEQVDITAKATGRVEKLFFQLGDRVNKGDLIAELEDDELQQQVLRAKASLAVVRASTQQREAELRNSQANLTRANTLLKEGLIPKTDFESRQTEFQVVQAQIQLAKAQERQVQAEINELEIRLAQSRIYAPMAGVVARRYIDQGAVVSASTPIISLVNLNTMVTMANVPEREVGKLRIGNQAMIEVDAFAGQQFQGKVARISPVLDAATRSATVEVEIANTDHRLKAEMFARVTLDLESTHEAVIIPREGLVYRGQQPGVYATEHGKPVFRPIETGRTIGADVEVLANLDAGTAIVTRGATMLREGDEIRVADENAGGGAKQRASGTETVPGQ
ncbi:MAG: efflux RND transporter periplasmic adaptor subunit [Bryobacteraceae bacterium]|nr:efflux RND transporter periplasmic adaptor subunit [Bryobacteraceae bacterium]